MDESTVPEVPVGEVAKAEDAEGKKTAATKTRRYHVPRHIRLRSDFFKSQKKVGKYLTRGSQHLLVDLINVFLRDVTHEISNHAEKRVKVGDGSVTSASGKTRKRSRQVQPTFTPTSARSVLLNVIGDIWPARELFLRS